MSAIYPQHIYGTFRKLKNYGILILLSIYFGCSWIRWNRGEGLPSQALLIDLQGRRAYLFGIEIWPDEVYYITGMLILAAMGLFFITALFGRIWCGYACPHTVLVDLFRYVELYFQGDRNERLRLDAQSMTGDKMRKKLLTHSCWLLIAFSFAFGWVCYFYDAPTLIYDLMRLQVSSTATIWLLALTASTYLFAGYVRERMCMHMCPYGRFQSAMVDQNTYVVTYHNWRGEPRGNYNPSDTSLGDCIDCGKCVVVCPMGIDIRDGLQMACIGCGLCVDACNTVMPKLGRLPDLIAYDSMTTTASRRGAEWASMNFFRIKILLFGFIFVTVSSIMAYSLAHKAVYNAIIERERGPMFTITPDGAVRNTYNVKLLNRTHQDQIFKITVSGVDKPTIMLAEKGEYQEAALLAIPAGQEVATKLFIKSSASSIGQKHATAVINIEPTDSSNFSYHTVLAKKTMFFTPDK
ncbi:MAG: cytochrome c oxidase accessory protein CcoG [Proteobacteria bacterium]|nr:cytochrome c oxidase accessory protein CcoG [Pseudomonadota bacterium]